MERWPSGLRRSLAKRFPDESRDVGSNPTLSVKPLRGLSESGCLWSFFTLTMNPQGGENERKNN